MSTPIHPATVHFPIAFLSLAYGLDAIYGATTYLRLPYFTNTFSGSLADLSRASHYLLLLGIITGVPAVMSGGQQLVKMLGNGGMYEADGKTIRQKVKITFAHAALNDAVMAVSAYSWYTRRGEKLMAPGGLNILLSCLFFPVLLFAAKLGGSLVYNYGTGLNMAKKSKSK